MTRAELFAKPRAEKLLVIRQIQDQHPKRCYQPPLDTRALRVRRQVVSSYGLRSFLGGVNLRCRGLRDVAQSDQLAVTLLEANEWQKLHERSKQKTESHLALDHRRHELGQHLAEVGSVETRLAVKVAGVKIFGNPLRPRLGFQLEPASELNEEKEAVNSYLKGKLGNVGIRAFQPHISFAKADSAAVAEQACKTINERLHQPQQISLLPPRIQNIAAEYLQNYDQRKSA